MTIPRTKEGDIQPGAFSYTHKKLTLIPFGVPAFGSQQYEQDCYSLYTL